MSDEPDYIVIRPAPDLPPGFLPDRLNGRWEDRSRLGIDHGMDFTLASGGAVAVPTGRFETNDQGQVAEVYEVRP
ncbi:hypothetical protein ACIBQ0_17085 [Nocardia nova]|uniref:hypothetical protein n=1 Tax=Nocardia nova TaxID=37330 RepID=UPI00379231E1